MHIYNISAYVLLIFLNPFNLLQLLSFLNKDFFDLIYLDSRHHNRGDRQSRDKVSQGRATALVPDEDSWLPQRERAQLHNLLA